MEINEPTVLRKLPRAGVQGQGEYKFCQVYGVQSGHTRKRNEICGVIDGNSVNVYAAIDGQNLASWAVPPDSTFVCPPSSKRVKLNDGTTKRQTWCVVRRQGQLRAQQYYETRTRSDTNSAITGSQLTHQKASILGVEPLPESAGLLISYKDGSLTTMSDDATVEIACFGLFPDTKNINVHYLKCLQAVAARSSILKARQDLALNLTDRDVVFMAVYTQSEPQDSASNNLHYGIWSWSVDQNNAVVQLIDHDLGMRGTSAALYVNTNLTPTASTLKVRSESMEITYDLASLLLHRTSERKISTGTQSGFLDISKDIQLCATNTELQLHNIRFASLLAAVPHEMQATKKSRRGRSRADFQMFAYFPQLRRVLACSDNKLLAIDVQPSASSAGNLKRSSLLVENIVRGSGVALSSLNGSSISCSIGSTRHRSNTSDLKDIFAKLEEVAKSLDVTTFERLVIECVQKDETQSHVANAVLEFALSQIFDIEMASKTSSAKEKIRLTVRFLPSQVLKLCIQDGLLTDQALYRTLSMRNVSHVWLPLGTVCRALLDYDPTLDLIDHYIQNSPYLEPEVLAVLVQSLIRKILEPEQLSIEDSQMTGSDTASTALTVRPSHPTLKQRVSINLVHALQFISLAGPSTVTQQFRNSLSQTDTLALIQFLRQQLFQSGFTRHANNNIYPTPPPSTNGDMHDSSTHTNNMPQLSLASISTLLNGCVDALGPLGVLAGADSPETQFLESLVPDLLSEISTAAIAVEESAQLQGLLRESLRYVSSVERHGPPSSSISTGDNRNTSGRGPIKGKVVTVYEEPEDDVLPSTVVQSALPISLKARTDIDPYKIRKGGGQVSKRSKREMGMLTDRTRSAYAFQRLVL